MSKKKPISKKIHIEKLAKAKEVLSRMNVIDFPIPEVTKGMTEEEHRDAVEQIVSAILVDGAEQKLDGELQGQVIYDLYEIITGDEFSGYITDEEVDKFVDFFMNIPNRLVMWTISSLHEKSLLYRSSMMSNMNKIIESLESILQTQTTTGESIPTSENEE